MFLEENDMTFASDEVVNDVETNFSDITYDKRSEEIQTNVDKARIEDAFGVTIGAGETGHFWKDTVHQCREQLNIATTEKEICKNVSKEISENIEFYCQKFNVPTNAVSQLCKFWKTSCIVVNCISILSQVRLSSIFQCQVIQLDKLNNCSKVIEVRTSTTFESAIYFGISSEEALVKVCPIIFKRETLEKFKDIPNLSSTEITYDRVGAHLKTPYSGSAEVFIHSHKYNSTSVATHITDLYQMLEPI